MSSPIATANAKHKKLAIILTSSVLVFLIVLGAMAKNGWLPGTDPMTGERIGWFGRPAATRNNSGVAAPLPTSTPTPPQLSKEYIYAGGRMLAVEDANASAAPPADLAVWRPSSGYWYVLGGQGSAQISVQWGLSGDQPVPGDFDGDGKTDFCVFRPGVSYGDWFISNSSNGNTVQVPFGFSNDKVAPADYDGDGKTDVAVYRPSNGTWYIQRSTLGFTSQAYGLSSDVVAPADYDGDGKADIAVWRGSSQTFYVQRSSDGQTQSETVGQTSGDIPVSADYDGDGKADYAVKSGNVWHIKQSLNGTLYSITWQLAADKEVQNDYDGDGRVDIAVWRGTESSPGAGDVGNWYIRQSSLGGQLRQVLWGMTGDVPVPAFYRR